MRILCLLSDVPSPPITGGRQRSYLQLRALKELAELRIIVITNGKVTNAELAQSSQDLGLTTLLSPRPAASFFPWNLARWTNPHLVDRVAAALDWRPAALLPDDALAAAVRRIADDFKPDLSWTRYYLTGALAHAWNFSPAVLDLDDVDTDYLHNLIADPSTSARIRRMSRIRLRTLNRRFLSDLRKFAALTLSNTSATLQAAQLSAPLIPNIPFFSGLAIPTPPPPSSSQDTLIAVATWGYPPNALGLSRFISNVWPRIRTERPTATLNVVGGGLREPFKSELAATPGIILSGFVDSLRDHYASAAIAIAPVYQGGGTKIKVLEAIAHARATVVTPHAHHGYEHILKPNDALLVASSDAQFADHILSLINDVPNRDAMATRAFDLVSKHFSYTAVRDGVHEVVRRVGLK